MHTCLHIIPEVIVVPGGRWRRAWPEVLACLEAARADPDVRHVLTLIGGSCFGREARALGAAEFERIAPPLSEPRRAARCLERLIDATDPGMIVTWDAPTASWVERLRGIPGRSARVDLSSGQVECRGLDPETGEVLRHWVTLTPEPMMIPACASRADLRASLGLEGDTRLIGVLGDDPERGDTLMYALGMLGASGLRCVGLCARTEPRRGPLLRHVREHGQIRGICFSRAGPLPLWLACDVCLLASPPDRPASCAWTMIARGLRAAGMPLILAEDGPPDDPGDTRPPLMRARSGSPMDLARAARAFLAGHDRATGRLTPPAIGPQPLMGRQIVAALRDVEALA
ncbi:MAG: hypothetical protein HBSAPP03_16860 [Phycisphaerae bacterium]|nr:MAG: hypothetical protein HBSAPP03_16860 [Phycisphaerae bacterium]